MELTLGPFTLQDALRVGLTRDQLKGRSWRRLGPGLYAWRGLAGGPALLLEALALRLPESAVFSGRTAAWVHGLDVPPPALVEVTMPRQSGVSGRVGMSVRRASLDSDDVETVRGLRVTTALRTLADVVTRLPLVEAVVLVDSALRLGRVTMGELEWWVGRHARAKGVKRLREVVELADPGAESPMETRLRMLIVLAGLPRPESQVDLHDEAGGFLARVDLYYRRFRLAIEYDGATHRESLLEDNRRQNRLLGSGYRLLRFAGGDVLRAPESVVAEVRSALLLAA